MQALQPLLQLEELAHEVDLLLMRVGGCHPGNAPLCDTCFPRLPLRVSRVQGYDTSGLDPYPAVTV